MADTTTTPLASAAGDQVVTVEAPAADDADRRLPDPGITVVPEPLDEEVRRLVAAVLTRHPPRRRPVYEVTKRALDLVVAVPLLVLTAPLMAVLGLVIRLESPGPAVFRQPRAGRHGRIIGFCKFRTMYADARERHPELYDYRFTPERFATAHYKPSVDPRHTRVGRAVRRTTLDELPNLFNVVMGDVSLVGPRPELPELVRYYSTEQLQKFGVRSGITGLAQVSGRNNLTIQEQIALDLEYVARASLTYDLRLLGRTVVMVLKRVGAE